MSKNLYLITGDEIFEKEEMLEKIKSRYQKLMRGINYIIIEKENIRDLEKEINTYSFFSTQKLIIVKLSQKTTAEQEEEKVEWFTEDLEAMLRKLSDVCVVFYGDIQKRSKLFKFVQTYGECIVCEKKKDYEVLTWSASLFKANDICISNADISYLISLAGTDRLTLKNEIDKLINYASETKKIEKNDIDASAIKTSDVIVFDLTDNLGNKKIGSAINSLNELIQNKEPIQKIAIMIAKHFKTLLVVKMAMANHKTVADELTTKSTYAINKYINQSKYFSISELAKVVRELAKLDIDSKTGKIDLKVGLERVIVGYGNSG